jgi:LacI family transcriptional regulator, repressor for deo operon, udp, cdd, tsx, nupC, and nupG
MSARDRSPHRRATIRDVAARAGVATSTVSRALSNPDRVHPVTRERIVAAAREVGYRSRPRRRVAPDRPRGSIALLIPDIANPYYAELTRGTQIQLNAAGFSQVLVDTEESAEAEERALRQLGGTVDGVVLAATRSSDRQLQEAAHSAPIVLVNRVVTGVSSVHLDTGVGMRQAVDHLASLGHDCIVYLSGPAGSWSDGLRWSAIEGSASAREITALRLGPFSPNLASGPAAADALLNTAATACIAFNDLLAIGVLQRLHARGVKVPDELAVVGCDDVFGADFCSTPLTTVTGDLERVGRTAVDLLLGLLENPRREPRMVTMPTHLTIRASTGSELK